MIIQFNHVNKTYAVRGNLVPACQDINLSIDEGDIFGIVGYSGAGKSTLIRMVNALERPTDGQVVVNHQVIHELQGDKLRQARKDIAMIFQNFNLLNSRTVFENIAMPLRLNHVDPIKVKQCVTEILQFVELTEKANVYPAHLSGGQKQRVGIARALVTNPSILLCDEPTSALDPKTTDSILELLVKANRKLNVTIMIITHQINIVQKVCNKVAIMDHGHIVETGFVKNIFAQPTQAITQTFVDAVVDDRIPETILEHAKTRQKPSRIFKVRCLDGNVCDTFVPALRAQFAAEICTLSMSVTELQGSVLTSIGLQAMGDEFQLDAVSNYLHAHYEVKEMRL